LSKAAVGLRRFARSIFAGRSKAASDADVALTARRVASEFLAHRWRLFAYVAILAVAAITGVGVPLLTMRLIDSGLGSRDATVVIVCGCLILALGVANTLASAAGQALGSIIGTHLIYDLRRRLYAHLQLMPLDFFARSQSGALLSRVNNDVIEGQGLVQTIFGSTVAGLVSLTAAVVTMLALSPLLTVIALLAAPLLLIPVRIVGRRVRGLARQQARENSQMNSYLSERLNVGGALLRLAFGNQDIDRAHFETRAATLRDVVRNRNVAFAKGAFLLGTLGVLGYAVVYLIGGVSVTHGSLSIGTLVAMAALLKLAYDPLINISTQGINLYGGLVAFERVYEVLDFPPAIGDPQEPVELTEPAGEIEFRRVWFRYREAAEATLPSLLSPDHKPPVDDRDWTLQDINWRARRGTTTAIVGTTGAGKTTLIGLVSRLYDPTEGQVLVNGVDVRQLSLSVVRASIGIVSQDAYLFNDTLGANLRLAKPDATDEELEQVCREASLHKLVDALPNGFDTVMGDRGYRLSGGEKQRVALARVFLKNPSIVILDEATAHLDTVTERAVRTALTQRLANRTIIVVAHRMSTVVDADQILVLDSGKIVESGTHDELLRNGSLYRHLHDTAALAQP
jgi:ATP-binding cassette subfamily B protein